MRCRRARRSLLTVGPELLSVAAGDEARGPEPRHDRPALELLGHLAGCEECRRVAEAILDAQRRLDAALGELGPRVTPEEAVEVALAGRSTPRSEPGLGVAKEARSGPELRRAARWLPLAAAAAVAALLLAPPGERPSPGSGPEPAAQTTAEPRFSLEVPPDRRVAVFETRHPTITVVWFVSGAEAEDDG